jgi:hypothetical protein
MSAQLIDIDGWIGWLEAVRQASVVVVPVVLAVVVVYAVASAIVRLRWRP